MVNVSTYLWATTHNNTRFPTFSLHAPLFLCVNTVCHFDLIHVLRSMFTSLLFILSVSNHHHRDRLVDNTELLTWFSLAYHGFGIQGRLSLIIGAQ